VNRDEIKAERKLRLCWLEKECKRDKAMNKFVAELEENFDDDELEAAKVFSVDFLTNGGFFTEFEKTIDLDDVEGINKIVRNYGLEPADGMFIMDTMEDIFSIFSAEKGDERDEKTETESEREPQKLVRNTERKRKKPIG